MGETDGTGPAVLDDLQRPVQDAGDRAWPAGASNRRPRPTRRCRRPTRAGLPARLPSDVIKVFIVEDSQDFAEALAELLAANDGKCGIVGTANSEQSALDWSFEHEAGFDVAIVDLLLRDGSGFAVLAHMAKYQPGKIVVLSEFVTPVMAERCKALGAVAAYQKSRTPECVAFVRDLAGVL